MIDCLPNKESIRNAFDILYSKKFQSRLKTIQNPYDQGNSSKKVIKVLKTDLLDNILKKSFYNLNF